MHVDIFICTCAEKNQLAPFSWKNEMRKAGCNREEVSVFNDLLCVNTPQNPRTPADVSIFHGQEICDFPCVLSLEMNVSTF